MVNHNYWLGKNVFITGINGFIGGNLAKTLVSKGANVFGLLRNRRKDTLLYYEEIADKLSINIGTVKSRLNRAKHAFKRYMNKQGYK